MANLHFLEVVQNLPSRSKPKREARFLHHFYGGWQCSLSLWRQQQ